MASDERLTRLSELDRLAELGGGQEKLQEQTSRGKLTARARIEKLLDPGSFVELDKFAVHRAVDFGMEKKKYLGDGVIAGYGKIDGRQIFIFSHDFTVLGGSLGEIFGKKVIKIMDLALKTGCPIIGLNDSGGARIQEGVGGLAAYSEIFYRNTLASGVIPQISAIMGPCAGGAVYSPAMTDFVFMVDKISRMFVTGPDVVRAALGEEVTAEDLGGATVHSQLSGVASFWMPDEETCLAEIRRLLSFLPLNNSEQPPRMQTKDDANRLEPNLISLIPSDPYKSYDVKEVITLIVDEGDFLEVHAGWAPNVVVGFARLNGSTVGVVANQPQHLSGALDLNSSRKAARFVRFCDCFNIPILTLVDVPGYMPGKDQEHGGIIVQGCKLLFAYCEASVPKVTLILRKAYGGAYCAMGSKYSRADINYAWPTAEIAVMGPEGAANVIFRREIEEAENKEATMRNMVNDYRAKFANPYIAAERGIIDSVIDPAKTRPMLISAFEALSNKREARPPKKHGNIQL